MFKSLYSINYPYIELNERQLLISIQTLTFWPQFSIQTLILRLGDLRSNQILWMDNNFKGRRQNVLVKCSDIMTEHNVKLAGHIQNLVRQCLMIDCYFRH